MAKDRKIRVLVTGTTGFLGSNVLKALMARPELEAIAACRKSENDCFSLRSPTI